MCATVHPAETIAQLIEDTMDLPVAEGLSQALPAAAGEEGCLARAHHIAAPPTAKAPQRLDCGRVQWHLA
jgi:hypothetical protein